MWRWRPPAGLLVPPHQAEQRLPRHLKAFPSYAEQPRWRHACRLWGHQASMLQQASPPTLHSLQRNSLCATCVCTLALQGSLQDVPARTSRCQPQARLLGMQMAAAMGRGCSSHKVRKKQSAAQVVQPALVSVVSFEQGAAVELIGVACIHVCC